MSSAAFSPAMPPLAPDHVSGLGVLTRLQVNGLSAFPRRCFDEPVVRLGLPLPGRALFLVSDGAAMVEMLQSRAGDFRRLHAARRILSPVVGRGLLTSEGEQWRKQRKAMAPAFTPRALPMMAGHIVRAIDPVIAALTEAGDAPVDLFGAMQRLSLEIAAVSMFSIEAAEFRDQVRSMVSHYTATIGRPRPQDFLLPAWAPTSLTLRRRLFRRRWRALMEGVVAKRRAMAAAPAARDLFDLLAAVHGTGEDDLLVDEVATMIVAGHETTALTLCWALYLLANDPEWQQRLREEASAIDLDPARAAAALPNLPVAHAVLNETLRLYTPAFMTARLAATDTSIGGCAVPRGSMVLAPFWILHRRPERWSAPDAFDPRRFLDRPAPERGSFLPFGIGPRACIGAQLAQAEGVLSLARIVTAFDIRPLDRTPLLPVATITTRPSHTSLFRLVSLGQL